MNLKGRIKKIFFFGLRSKLVLLLSIVIVFSNTFMLYFSVSKYSQKLEDNNITYSDQVIGNLIGNLEEYIKEVENITDLVIYNYYIQDYLISINKKSTTATPPVNYQNAQMGIALLGNIISTRSDISSIFIFDNDSIALHKASPIDINADFDFKSQSWYKSALEQPDSIFISGPNLPIYSKTVVPPVFSISRSIDSYDGSGNIGVILVDTNLNMVKNYCNSAKLANNGFLFIVNDNGDIVYSPDIVNSSDSTQTETYKAIYQNITQSLKDNPTGHFNADIKNEEYQVVYKTMSRAAWHVVAVSPYKSITSDANKIRDLIILVGIICLALVTLFSIILSNRFTRPIIQLKKYMDKADHGNLDIRVPVESNDEVGMLSESFNHMLERLDGLMKQTVSDQEEKRKLELKALQHQINPHFLYNTLDSIIWMAEIKDENVVPMTEALSKLFRISLSRGQEMITLRDELEHVRNYLFIQSMRYLNKFDFKIDAPEYLLNYKTIKLILQPIVENSIYHGIKNKVSHGNIDITAYEENNHLVISVADDGIGMDEQTCRRILAPDANPPVDSKSKNNLKDSNANLNESVEDKNVENSGNKSSSVSGAGAKSKSGTGATADSDAGVTGESESNATSGSRTSSGSGFGVRNVDERIKLYFGKEYGLRFESELGVGTTVYVTLPLLNE